VGVTWLAGFDFEIKVIARLPHSPFGKDGSRLGSGLDPLARAPLDG
jgi:hypothetical protein